MEFISVNEIMIGLLSIIGIYFILKYLSRQQEKPDIYSEILNREEYQVKGQWEK